MACGQRAWFLEITFMRKCMCLCMSVYECVCVCVCVCVCMPLRPRITSGMILTLYDWLNNNSGCFPVLFHGSCRQCHR